MNTQIGLPVLIALVASASTCALILRTKNLHIALAARRNDLRAVQAAHSCPTPRIGGIALIAGLFAAAACSPPHLQELYPVLALSLLPVGAAGLLEDMGFRLPPAWRLAAAVLSGLCVTIALNLCLPRLGIPGLDTLMTWPPFAILFTLFAAAGVCNAFNLIDGMNGLAGLTAVLVSLGIAGIAVQANETQISHIAFFIAAATAGFLLFNFPSGRIFLGDAGAYALGHLLAWLGVLLVARIGDLSPWAVLLVFFWPVADTLLAIWRRWQAGKPSDQPDRLHFHQLVMRGLEIMVLGRNARRLANPLTTLLLLPMISAPIAVGALLWNDAEGAMAAVILFAVLFILTYALGMTLAANRGRIGAANVAARIRSRINQIGLAQKPQNIASIEE
ncbi:MraY family glycosyltransferase [Cereibacter sphaeroides]|uniref:MraY family glycosyltransferase n=1 Tax=Cereibacter sphaeroides TaxID=1063 RepID=UPI003FCD4520